MVSKSVYNIKFFEDKVYFSLLKLSCFIFYPNKTAAQNKQMVYHTFLYALGKHISQISLY